MKFGKHIQAQQVPGWSAYYLDYKFLKKIISSLAANRPASEAAALALGLRPIDVPSPSPPSGSPSPRARGPSSILDDGPGRPPIFSASGQDEDRGPDFQAHRAAFFFKLERELEKINAFYLQKEAELTLRLETLLSKRRAAAMRGLPDTADDTTYNHVEWSAVEEGFRLLERDLGKLQQFVEINAIGFRKILKKFDKRSTSTTKELYLARQVDVQPVFNRQLISELSDTVATCLVDVTDLSSGLKFEGRAATDIFLHQLMTERTPHLGPFHDLENNLRKAVAAADETAITDCIHYSDALSQQSGGKMNVTRILWSVIIEAPPDLADLILSKLNNSFDYQFVDDINGRTCLHEAAIAGTFRLAVLCIQKGVQADKVDVYGRSALHYASMNGHADICQRLLEAKLSPNALDLDNYSPLVYATLKGSVECVRVLLDVGKVSIEPTAPVGDLIPISLASQSGHVDVVLLLLQHGAKSLANTSGEYPMHLAAREGHTEVCKLLLHHEGWDTPDKYHEWTPLFHAARYGHDGCLHVLLEAGSRVNYVDEVGHSAVHYAAWYGHHESVNYLLQFSAETLSSSATGRLPDDSPLSDVARPGEAEIDSIPSLSLPPPIMPHRVYGHNYLDKSHLVQVTIGHTSRSKDFSGVRLHPRLISLASKDEYLLSSTPLKLVMTTSRNVNSAPYSISLPQRDDKGVFSFQIMSLDSLLLEFSIYPNFGTKTIGRAVALPSLFTAIENNQEFVLPILDTRLHVVGEVSFQVNIITSFRGVTLEVGGDVETYWKSMALHVPNDMQLLQPRRPYGRPSSIGSAQASPSTHSISNSTFQTSTISSLKGTYAYVIIQVTRDLHPVVYADWLLPETGFDLTIADITLAQFEALGNRLGRNLDTSNYSTIQNWQEKIPHLMISLAHLMKVLPPVAGLSLDLAYPSPAIKERYSIGHRLDLNVFVDSVLRTIYHTSATLGGPLARRKIVFTSFSPDVCSSLNWKQPNYPVFFASQCGKSSKSVPNPMFDLGDENDRRLLSLGAAVEFSKINNLLGIFVDANLLAQVPSLIQGIRNAGLLVGIFGSSDKLSFLTAPGVESNAVDAFMNDRLVLYTDHSQRELI